MSATVRATCPGCQNVLRIPAQWADKPVKCKKCGAVVQAKAPPGPAPEPVPAAPDFAAANGVAPPPPSANVPAPDLPPAPPGYGMPPAGDGAAYPPGYGPPPGYPGHLPPGYPQPPGYGYAAPPGYPAPPGTYPPPHGYPTHPAPGYGYAAPPGYPQPPGYGYGPPQGYPPPGYGYAAPPAPAYAPAPPPAESPFAAASSVAAGPALEDHPHHDDGEDEFKPRRRYHKQSPHAKMAVLTIVGVLILGAGAVAAVKLLPMLKNNAKPKEGDHSSGVEPKQIETAAPGKAPPKETATPAPGKSTPFARRMLAVSVTKYLYCNALTPGQSQRGMDQVTEAVKRLAFDWRIPTAAENNQLYILSDSAPKDVRPMLKPLIQEAFASFCDTSRPQDHVVLYFGGHAVEKDDKAYLVPVDGDLADPATLIPLDEIYAKLKDCKAQQKVMIFDVCRLNEDGDIVRPGGEPMSEKLEKKLLDAPSGVQVVTSCSAGQNALEFRRFPDHRDLGDVAGSAFLSALKHASVRNKVKVGKDAQPGDSIPIVAWVEAAKARLATIADLSNKPAQAAKLNGGETSQVAFNPDEPPAKKLELPPPPKSVSPEEIAKIGHLLDLPPIRPDPSAAIDTAAVNDAVDNVVPYTEDVMKAYKADGVSEDDILKDGEKYPVRKATLTALNSIRKEWEATSKGGMAGGGLRFTFDGDSNDKVKKEIAAEQETPARIILELEERAKEMDKLMESLDKEESKFWQATFLYAAAQVKARLAFMHEYDLALGNIRTDALPKDDKKGGSAGGLQMVSVEKMKSKKDVRDIGDGAKELFAKLAADHAGTPWAVQAKRNRVISLGLEWRAFNSGGKGDDMPAMKKE